MSNFPIWETPPLLMFVERSSNCLLFDRSRAADLRQITPSSRSLFAFKMSDALRACTCVCVYVCVQRLKQHLSFQEVVEKNLRHSQDTKKKRRDDGESADNDSILSTSSNLEPFANDDLGELAHAQQVWPGNAWGASVHAR